jgi:hypothetical protein
VRLYRASVALRSALRPLRCQWQRRREVEHGAVLRPFEVLVHPAGEGLELRERRDTFVLNGGENCAADQNLAAGVALALSSRGP